MNNNKINTEPFSKLNNILFDELIIKFEDEFDNEQYEEALIELYIELNAELLRELYTRT
jgi:hypothetical protein